MKRTSLSTTLALFALAAPAAFAQVATPFPPIQLNGAVAAGDRSFTLDFTAPSDGQAGGGVIALDQNAGGRVPGENGPADRYRCYVSTDAMTGTPAAWRTGPNVYAFDLSNTPGAPGTHETITVTPDDDHMLRALTTYYVSISYLVDSNEAEVPSPRQVVMGDDTIPPGDFGSVSAGAPLNGSCLVTMSGIPADDGLTVSSGRVRRLRAWFIKDELLLGQPLPTTPIGRNQWFLAQEARMTAVVGDPALETPPGPDSQTSTAFVFHAPSDGIYHVAIAAEDNDRVTIPQVGTRGQLNLVTVLSIDFVAEAGGGGGGGGHSAAGLGCGGSAAGLGTLVMALLALAPVFKR